MTKLKFLICTSTYLCNSKHLCNSNWSIVHREKFRVASLCFLVSYYVAHHASMSWQQNEA